MCHTTLNRIIQNQTIRGCIKYITGIFTYFKKNSILACTVTTVFNALQYTLINIVLLKVAYLYVVNPVVHLS